MPRVLFDELPPVARVWIFGAERPLVEAERARQDTVVFDNTVTTVGAVRDGRWELPAANSWHGRAFF